MKPKPKKLIEESMDDTEPITDDEDVDDAKDQAADAFDNLLSSKDESASKPKTNGNKAAPSPVKGLSSDEEDDGDAKDESNATNGNLNSTNDDDDDEVNNTSQESVKGDTADEASAADNTADENSTVEEENQEQEEDEEEEEGWEVEQIVGHKLKNGRKYYRLRWKGYTEADDTWQVEEDLACPELIEKYLESNPGETPTKKKKVRISLEPTREVPKRAAAEKQVVESEDEDGENVAAKKKKRTAKKSKKSPAKGKAKASAEYEVEKIVDDKKDGGKILYRIRWKGFKASDDTWEPITKLSCPEKIAAYKASKVAEDSGDYDVEKIMGEMFKDGKRLFFVKWKGYSEDDNTWESEESVSCHDLVAKFRDLCSSGKKRTADEAKITSKKSPVAAKKEKVTPMKAKASAKKSPKKGKATTKSPKKATRAAEAVIEDSDVDDNVDMPEYDADDGNEEGELITGDDLEYEVEKIVKERKIDGHKEYLIRWKGCSAKEDTWEHENNMTCPNILNEFMKKKKKK